MGYKITNKQASGLYYKYKTQYEGSMGRFETGVHTVMKRIEKVPGNLYAYWKKKKNLSDIKAEGVGDITRSDLERIFEMGSSIKTVKKASRKR